MNPRSASEFTVCGICGTSTFCFRQSCNPPPRSHTRSCVYHIPQDQNSFMHCGQHRQVRADQSSSAAEWPQLGRPHQPLVKHAFTRLKLHQTFRECPEGSQKNTLTSKILHCQALPTRPGLWHCMPAQTFQMPRVVTEFGPVTGKTSL